MSRAVRSFVLALAAVLACGSLAACGIPMQNEPVPLPSGAVPGDITAP